MNPEYEMIDECIEDITICKENPHMLWDILIQQLHNAKNMIGKHDPYSRQTIGCLGIMRGISGDQHLSSNALQRQFSNQLSQQVHDANQLYNDFDIAFPLTRS